MSKPEFPHARQVLAATTLAAGVIASSAACGAESREPAPTPEATQSVEPSPSEAPATLAPTTSPELEAAEERLETAAKTAAAQILEDMANPASLSAGYNGSYYGNKRGRIDNGLVYSSLPEMFVMYAPEDGADRDQRGLYINTVTAIDNPETPEEDFLFDGMSISFNVRETPNVLDAKLAEGQQLDVTDFQDFLSRNELSLRSVETTDGGNPLEVTTLTSTGEDSYLYEYAAGPKGAGPVVIDPANASKLIDVAQNLAETEAMLSQNLN